MSECQTSGLPDYTAQRGTTTLALFHQTQEAERDDRQWIACDISPRALAVLQSQFVKFHYAVDDMQDTYQPALIMVANVTTRGPHRLPQRTDEDPTESQDRKTLPGHAFKIPASIIPDKDMLAFLLELSSYTAWCCG